MGLEWGTLSVLLLSMVSDDGKTKRECERWREKAADEPR